MFIKSFWRQIRIIFVDQNMFCQSVFLNNLKKARFSKILYTKLFGKGYERSRAKNESSLGSGATLL